MKEYEIRQLCAEELEPALNFIWEIFARTDAKARTDGAICDFERKVDLEYTAARFGEGELRFWGAFDGESLVGVCVFSGLFTIHVLTVDPRERGNGLGTKLLKRAVFDSKRHDDEIARIVVEAPDTMTGFFVKLGFAALSDPTQDEGVWYTPMALQAGKA